MFQHQRGFDQLLDATFARRALPKTAANRPQLDISSSTSEAKQPQTLEEIDVQNTSKHQIEVGGETFWIQGDTVLCQCPDCQAPMAVRLWLGLADCWRCECSLELSREQIKAIEEVLPAKTPEPAVARSPLPISAPVRLDEPEPSPPAPRLMSREQELHDLTSGSRAAKFIRKTFGMTPAWLVSFLVHLIIILILALIVFNQASSIPSIVLSTFVSPDRTEGGEIRIVDPTDQLNDDLLEASKMFEDDQEMREVIQKAQSDANELLKDVVPTSNVTELKRNITTRSGALSSFAARDPRVRTEIVKKEGGTTLTEAAVARGLRWLASVQNKDGSWSRDRYRYSSRSNNKGDAAATSLALLPFLGAGQTHESGIYRETVAKGLSWLIANQTNEGEITAGTIGNHGMYAHGQATIVLSEAFALTGDQSLAEPTQLAIEFIEAAQHEQGGWRYSPGQAGDTSVFGWQLMALHSARAPNIGIKVDEDVMKLADYYLDRATATKSWLKSNDYPAPHGSLYHYIPKRDDPTHTMTAEAILCRMYLGWDREDPRIVGALNWLLKNYPPDRVRKNVYYWYYGTQVFHHFGGKQWKRWNEKMRDLLVESQERSGKYAGSWDPDDFQWGNQGERIYVTSLAVCTLEVYYRHLPLFTPIRFD